jgi:catechol-2,3-dioxygenase
MSHVSTPESGLPAGVQRLERPEPLVRETSLAFLRFEKRDLGATAKFMADFGLEAISSSDDELIQRGTGSAPCVYVARRAARTRFVGMAFTVPDDTDLNRLVEQNSGRKLDPTEVPSGANGIELTDPAGNALWLIANWKPVEARPVRGSFHSQANTPDRIVRVNATIRPPVEPATVVRLGHMVLQTANFPLMADWYMRHLGLIPTDVQYLADGSPALTFFRLDLGDQPADHHSFVLVAGLEEKFEHSAYEVVDIDAVGQGHQVLRANGHRHMWGIGRHVLGSQIFDYWFDPDGFQFEHYADGDVFTADYEPRYSPFEPGSIWAWGDDAPAEMRGKPSLGLLTSAVRALASGRISLNRLKLLGKAMSQPARPWL